MRNTNKKALIAVICAVLVLAVSVVGTLAYLTDKTGPVTNTFTSGKLIDDPETNFKMIEHEATDEDKDGVYTLGTKEVTSNTYTVIPGVDIPKDPQIKTLKALELDAYVFIEVVDGTGTEVSFTVDSEKWTEMTGVTGPNNGKVYVMKANNGIVEAGAKLGPITVLKDNKVKVNNCEITDTMTAEQVNAKLAGTIKVYGYMIQAGGFTTAAAAWAGFGFTK